MVSVTWGKVSSGDTTWSRTAPKNTISFKTDFANWARLEVRTRIFGTGIECRTSRYNQKTIATISRSQLGKNASESKYYRDYIDIGDL